MSKKVLVVGVASLSEITPEMKQNLDESNVVLAVADENGEIRTVNGNEVIGHVPVNPTLEKFAAEINEKAVLQTERLKQDLKPQKQTKEDYYIPQKIGKVINKARGNRR